MKIKRLLSICFIAIFSCLTLFLTTKSEALDEDYYVTFSADNYQKKSANKMTKPSEDADYYVLLNVNLDATNKFRVESNSGVIYYNKSGNAMSVSVTTASKYNIYFAKDYVYDEEHVNDTLTKTDAHISYEYYLKPSFKAVVGENEYELKFNQFNSSYDEYYIDEIKLNENDVISFKDNEGNNLNYSLDLEKYTVPASGTYRILYTPGKITDSNLYLYDENGNFGTGDDYKYYSYINEASLYYVVFKEKYISKYTESVKINNEDAYKLNYNHDDASGGYKSLDFYVGAPRATAFEPDGKGIAIHFHKWSCGRCRGKTIQAEKLRAQLQCSRSGRQVCQKAVMRKRAAEKTVALFRCPTHPVPPVRLKRRRFFVIVYRY